MNGIRLRSDAFFIDKSRITEKLLGNENIFDNQAIFNYTVNGSTYKVSLDNDAYAKIKELFPEPA